MTIISKQVTIPTLLEVGDYTLQSIGTLLSNKKFTDVALFLSDGIYKIVGSYVIYSLQTAGINILQQRILTSIDIDDIVSEAFLIPENTQVVIGIGGGRAIDASKYMAFLRNIPFISVPTSTSNDGFSSSSTSLLINGIRRSVPARMPHGIIIDTAIISSAPIKYLYSGIGDLVSNISATTDWYYEERLKTTTVNDFAAMIANKSVNSMLSSDYSSLLNDSFVHDLVDSLTLNGIAMEIAKTSAPCSGSEHLISHALDQLFYLNELHGIQVGLATYIMSYVQGQHEDVNRHHEIKHFLERTGFIDYAKTLGLRKDMYIEALGYAPCIKPDRHTYIHNERYRQEAIQFLLCDQTLNELFT